MNDTTPYDEARGTYTREALARLVLSSAAHGLADTARELVPTRHDAYAGPGGRVSEARTLVGPAEELLTRAVVYERERGASWADIARYLGVDAREAKERYAPELARWQEAFEAPYRPDETGRKRIPQLPVAAYDPDRAVSRLDGWAWLYVTIRDRHAVSAGLRRTGPPAEQTYPETEPDEITGTVRRPALRRFLALLASCTGAEFEAADWERTERNLTGAAPWTHPVTGSTATLRARLAPAASTDVISVTITGVHLVEHHLRITTLLDAFAS
ncbi:hypothetical protein [Streptomyces sp. NPDC048192]|uniref:hypothetical protein n=1 Tax=Streptomyces sp. NPDC048192 TaxID=3365510 RepID=UPI0037143443